MYQALKHIHMLLITLSVGLFIIRFVWLLQGSSLLKRKWVKILPHTIDTLLLVSAINMLVLVPWHLQPWLWEKLVLVTCYIGFGFMVMKFAKTKPGKISAFVAALLCVLGIVHLAVTKTPFLLG